MVARICDRCATTQKHTSQNDTSHKHCGNHADLTCSAHAVMSGSHNLLLATDPPTDHRHPSQAPDCTYVGCTCRCVLTRTTPSGWRLIALAHLCWGHSESCKPLVEGLDYPL
jgi:hypothetical protein